VVAVALVAAKAAAVTTIVEVACAIPCLLDDMIIVRLFGLLLV
jgi:hypothetical protein